MRLTLNWLTTQSPQCWRLISSWRCIASTISSTLSQMKPVLPGTNHFFYGTLSQANDGVPAAMDSIITRPKGSSQVMGNRVNQRLPPNRALLLILIHLTQVLESGRRQSAAGCGWQRILHPPCRLYPPSSGVDLPAEPLQWPGEALCWETSARQRPGRADVAVTAENSYWSGSIAVVHRAGRSSAQLGHPGVLENR